MGGDASSLWKSFKSYTLKTLSTYVQSTYVTTNRWHRSTKSFAFSGHYLDYSRMGKSNCRSRFDSEGEGKAALTWALTEPLAGEAVNPLSTT
jgi:hypothetical protein